STIMSGRTRPDRNCTSRSVPPASTLAVPEAPARILTASSTLVGAAKLRLGMFTPEFARAHLRGPRTCRCRITLGLHYHPPWREELCSNPSGTCAQPRQRCLTYQGVRSHKLGGCPLSLFKGGSCDGNLHRHRLICRAC